ncbi:flagellar assembly protein FliW [Salicibibacter cibarius]|uniref:Flagellar assembly factor FliW n=1 Tax=Salicibibacter cibarius TaxID=2743000 RepID=A0A7T6Z7P7_9BACI|nr:flagellar assembly protein FliW [Salicibibacter cibarius]QQK77906.1 flagellar assembly protein FliW [Salicibibacter cibarius]
MKISTKYNGEIEVSESEVIDFPNGLPAFENETRWILQHYKGPFYVLQSVHTAEVAFFVCEIFSIFPDYQIELPASVTEPLQLTDTKQASLWIILTIKDPFETSTANLAAPLVLNVDVKKGKQYILQDSEYSRQYPLLQRKESSSRHAHTHSQT